MQHSMHLSLTSCVKLIKKLYIYFYYKQFTRKSLCYVLLFSVIRKTHIYDTQYKGNYCHKNSYKYNHIIHIIYLYVQYTL